MKLNFKKEDLKENFQKVIIVIGLFILVIISIKSGGSVSQQNVSTVIMPENKTEVKETVVTQNPYQLAYNKCTHPKMNEEFEKNPNLSDEENKENREKFYLKKVKARNNIFDFTVSVGLYDLNRVDKIIWKNGEIEITRIVSSRYPGKDVYKLSIPKRENVKGVLKNTGEFEEYTVAYNGNPQLSRQADISDLRNLGKVIKSHGLTDEIVSTAFQLSRRIANQMSTHGGTNYQTLANEIESDMARNPNLKKVYSFDLVPPDGNNRIRYHANVMNGQITLSLEQNGNR